MTSEKLASLLQLAAEDLEVARMPGIPARPAAYHLSQAAEKAARAVCEYEGIQVGTTHNIGQIGALLPHDHPMRAKIEAQNYHSSASTRYRYPDPAGRLPAPPAADEIRHRVDDVSAFLSVVREFVLKVGGNNEKSSRRAT
jgi:HEPN domain-containing protein